MDRTEAPYSGSTTACRIFIERRAFSKVGRAGRHNAGPVPLPFSNRLSLYNHYRSSISCNSCIVLRHTFLSFSSSLSPFVKISLKFYSIGDELFFHASRKLQASFYYSKIGLAWIICWPGPETTSVCTTECLCVAHSFFSVYRNSRPLSWATSVVSQVLPTLSVSRSLSLWVVYTHTHRSSSSFFFLFFSNGRVLPPRLARSSRRKRVRVYTSSCDKPCNSIELARNRSTTILC